MDWCWRWSSNTLVTWCEGLTHWKRPWCWERLRAGGEGDNRGWAIGWHHQLDGRGFGWTPGVVNWQGTWCAAVHGVSKSQTWLSDWTVLNWCQCLGFPGGSVVKNPPAKAADTCSNPGLVRSPGGGCGNPLQYSCQNNPMDRGAWRAAGESWVNVEKSHVQINK